MKERTLNVDSGIQRVTLGQTILLLVQKIKKMPSTSTTNKNVEAVMKMVMKKRRISIKKVAGDVVISEIA